MIIKYIMKRLIIILFALSVLTFPSYGQDTVDVDVKYCITDSNINYFTQTDTTFFKQKKKDLEMHWNEKTLQECSIIYDRKENIIRNTFISFGIFNIIRSIVGR